MFVSRITKRSQVDLTEIFRED